MLHLPWPVEICLSPAGASIRSEKEGGAGGKVLIFVKSSVLIFNIYRNRTLWPLPWSAHSRAGYFNRWRVFIGRHRVSLGFWIRGSQTLQKLQSMTSWRYAWCHFGEKWAKWRIVMTRIDPLYPSISLRSLSFINSFTCMHSSIIHASSERERERSKFLHLHALLNYPRQFTERERESSKWRQLMEGWKRKGWRGSPPSGVQWRKEPLKLLLKPLDISAAVHASVRWM